MAKVTVISGDVVSSTSLVKEDRLMLHDRLKDLFGQLSSKFDTYGRVLKGDYIECVCRMPAESLAVALAIKSYVKSIEVQDGEDSSDQNRIKLFKTHGIRLALGYGELSTFDTDTGVIDGEAIYLSGRKVNEHSGRKKQRIVIKQTLFFESNEATLKDQFDPVMGLLDVLISKATARQSEVLYWKLMGLSEDEIAQKFGVSQSVINQHSTSVGWNAIEETVAYNHRTIMRHHS